MAVCCRNSYLIRRLHVRCSNSDLASYKEFDVYVSEDTNVHLLQEYISEVKLIEGIYLFKGNHIIALQVDVIKVNNGDILEIHKFRIKQGNLHNFRLQIFKERKEEQNITVPIRTTRKLLQFIIQSDVYIKIEHQCFQRHNRKWRVNDSYILNIPYDFENLMVVDTSYTKYDYRPLIALYGDNHNEGQTAALAY